MVAGKAASLLRLGAALVADDEHDEDAYSHPWQAIDEGLPAAVEELRECLHEKDRSALEGTWLVEQALRVAKLRVRRAQLVLHNLVNFRRSEGWPLPLTADAVGGACLRSGMHQLLPPDQTGCPVLLYQAAKLDPSAHPISSYQRLGSYLMEVVTRDPTVQHAAVTLLLDLEGINIGLAGAFPRLLAS